MWVGRDAYLLSSEELPEIFYNRGGLLSCSSVRFLESFEERFTALHARPALTVFETCSRATQTLAGSGYQTEDIMTVMAATGEGVSGGAVEIGRAKSAKTWGEAYLRAFYGELSLLPTVVRIVKPLMSGGSSTLLQAEVDDRVVGTLAAYRSDGLLGVYCLGTVPGFRRQGVAGALLSCAREMALSEERTVILQTLESDGVVPFYTRNGFRVLYRKVLMVKKG